jgi:hypothetical protein
MLATSPLLGSLPPTIVDKSETQAFTILRVFAIQSGCLLKRFAQIMEQRLEATLLQVLDIYAAGK